MKKKFNSLNKNCRFCNSKKITEIINFGNVGLAGGFLLPNEFKCEKKYPQQLFFCEDCFLLQIINEVDSRLLFKDYFYFSSAISTLRKHFRKYAEDVTNEFLIPDKSTVLEIGCNDGILLKPFIELGIKKVIGVDPSSNVISTIKDPDIIKINDFLTENLARSIIQKHGEIDLICANNVFAHINNMHDVTNAIKLLLKDDGIFIFEVHYIGSLIDEVQYDMIYHEHIYYYSLITLQKFFEKFDLEIFDIKPIPIHGGSMRYYVRNKGKLINKKTSLKIINLQKTEYHKGYDNSKTFLNYARMVNITRLNLMSLLKEIKNNNKSIIGYGASGRANTLIQYCNISNEILDYIVDDAPMKQGYYTPGSHLKIKSAESIEENMPDYILIFAWSFFNEIIEKNIKYLHRGVKFIIPLPEVKIISSINGEIIEKIYKKNKEEN
tara:strand:+ start:23696 stop:25006 length:1311 start_codon:yes stop_codon:yes gene_type:complete